MITVNSRQVNNVAEVIASNQLDPDSTPNNNVLSEDDQDSASTTPIALIDLSLDKTIDNSTPDVGTNVVFTIAVNNAGPSDATSVKVKDLLPTGYTYVSDDGSGAYINGTGLWTIGGLASGSTTTLKITATVNPTGNYTNGAEVTMADQNDVDSTPNNNVLGEDDQDEATSTPRQIADLSLTKGVDNTTPNVGDNVIFTITVGNSGPSSATGVVATDKLPTGYSFVSATPSLGSYDAVSGAWTIGTMASGATGNLTITAKVLASGIYNNVAEITGSNQYDPDSTPGNNDATEDDQDQVVVTPVEIADLYLDKTVDNQTPDVGTNVVFTVKISNDGPSTATDPRVKDILPSGYSFVGYTATSGTYDNVSGIWNIQSPIVNQGNEILQVTAKVLATGNYTNVAEVTAADQLDPDSLHGNNIMSEDDQDLENTTPTPIIDLSLDKSVDNVTPLVGNNVVFTIAVNNAGPSDATGVVVKDVLPTGYTYVSDDGGGAYVNGTGLWTIGGLASGLTTTLNITATVNATGNYTNGAEVTAADQNDIDSTPNNNILSEDDQDEVSTTQTALVDVSLTKVVDNPTPNVGDNVTFTITVNNAGPSDATGVVVTDKLPSGFTYVSDTGLGAYQSGSGSWSIGNLAIGANKSINIVAKVNATGNYNNIAEVTGLNEIDSDSTPGNNDATEDDQDNALVTPIEIADLSLTKGVDNATPTVGDDVTFTITVNNAGSSDATGVIVKDVLPSGYSYVSYSSTSGIYNSSTGDWTIPGAMANATSQTLQITAKVLATGNYTNVAEVTAADQQDPDSTPNNNVLSEDDQDSVSTTPDALIDLSLNKSIDNSTPDVGTNVVFTIAVNNAGPSDATGVVVFDKLPIGYAYISDDSGGSYNTTLNSWTIGNLMNGATTTLHITAKVMSTGNYTNGAEVTAADQNDVDSTPNNNILSEDDQDEATSSPRQIADLSLTKGVDNATPNVGDNVVFTITVGNSGPSSATGVVATDKLPTGYSFVSATPSLGTYNAVSGAWTIGTMASGATENLTITAKILASGIYNNVAEITGSNQYDPDSTPGNNDATEDDQDQVVVTPIEIADLELTKTIVNNTTTSNVGQQISFEIHITNNGPNDASGVIAKDMLPTGYIYVNYSSTKGIYNPSTGDWNIGIIRNGETEILIIDVTVNATGNYTNVAEVTASDQLDPDSTPNNNVLSEDDQDSVSTTPVALIDLSLNKSIDNSMPYIGTNVVFTIAVNNAGPSDATGVKVTDVLPTGYTYVSDDGAGAYINATGLWTIGGLTSGSTTTLKITATVNPTGNYTNGAEVTMADQNDVDSTPNNNILSEDDQDEVQVNTVPLVDISVNKTIDNLNPIIGENAIFTITVNNAGPSDATGVVVTDLLETGYTFVSYSATIGNYNYLTGSWDVGNLANGSTETLSIVVKVNSTGVYVNRAQLTGLDEKDIDSTPANNNTSEDDESVVNPVPIGSSDLSLTKTVDDANPFVGNTVTFTIDVTNDGPSDATGVVVKDLLPTGYTFVSYGATSGTYDNATGLWTFSSPIINATTETLLILADVNAKGNYMNVAEVIASNNNDPDSTPNNGILSEDDQAEVSTSPIPVADLGVTKTVDNETPISDTEVTYTITVTNNGPSDASGVVIKDLLPSGLTYISSQTSVGTYDISSGKWNVGAVLFGFPETLTIKAKALAIGDYMNVAELIAANEIDSNSTPNNNNPDEDDQDSVTIVPIVLLKIPNGFSPNGDGINDVFMIRNLQILYPNFKLEIYNRWGNRVYKYKHNGNPSWEPTWFDGFSNGRMTIQKSNRLPVGTYYYLLYFNKDNKRPQTGWIYLNR